MAFTCNYIAKHDLQTFTKSLYLRPLKSVMLTFLFEEQFLKFLLSFSNLLVLLMTYCISYTSTSLCNISHCHHCLFFVLCPASSQSTLYLFMLLCNFALPPLASSVTLTRGQSISWQKPAIGRPNRKLASGHWHTRKMCRE